MRQQGRESGQRQEKLCGLNSQTCYHLEFEEPEQEHSGIEEEFSAYSREERDSRKWAPYKSVECC